MVYSRFERISGKLFNPLALILAGLLLAATLAVAAPANAALQIDIDKSSQQMTVSQDGAPLYQWPVSTGLAGHDTPSGDYTPFRMEESHFSKEWDDAPMPHSIFFTQRGHAIHGTMDERYMGRAASHGCVRLEPANAAVLFSLVKAEGMANTRINIMGTIPGGPGAPAVATQRRQGPGWFTTDPRARYGANYEVPAYRQGGYETYREERRARRLFRRGWRE